MPDLKPFLLNSLIFNGRRWKDDDGRLSFKTPDKWTSERGVRPLYEGLTFERRDCRSVSAGQVLGVGHPVMNRALTQAEMLTACATLLPTEMLNGDLLVFSVVDRITGQSSVVRQVVIGVEVDASLESGFKIVQEQELLAKLNSIGSPYVLERLRACAEQLPAIGKEIKGAADLLETRLRELRLPFEVPCVEMIAFLGSSRTTTACGSSHLIRLST